MTISELIQAFLQEARQTKTQREIAKRLAISPGYLNHLMSGKQDISQITLGTFSRMFPRAEVWLDGAPGGITQNGHHNAATANGDAIIQAAPASRDADAEAVAAFRQRLSNAVLDLDIPGEAARAVLKAIRDTR